MEKQAVDIVIERFGGQSSLARLIGKRQSTVAYWSKSGSIPSKWHSQLLSLAGERGIPLTPTDFFNSIEPTVQRIVKASPKVPIAKWAGVLPIGDTDVPCYVLSDDRRVISRNGAVSVLAKSDSGDLESYLRIEALKEFLPEDFSSKVVEFELPEVKNKTVKGIEAEAFLDICKAYVKALAAGALKTPKQIDMASRCAMFISACAKVGLIALVDEATGYQYERANDALQFKLKAFLEDEMRKWEKTFPDELWVQFGRLTRWKGSVNSRPKYWGKLVMELVYEYLDKDVAEWLKKNAPKPRGGQNYHQWLSSQYGLKKLVEHIWMLIGMASACHSMSELRQKMAEKFGRQPVQYTLYLDSLNNLSM